MGEILVIDIGNQRLKWAVLRGEAAVTAEFVDRGAAAWTAECFDPKTLARDCGLERLSRPAAVWVACVADARIATALRDYARAAWRITPVFLRASATAAGVVNGYTEPHTLGADRWAALAAAANLFARRAVVVVDAGTAVTVDALGADGRHQGGVILPGAAAMQAALGAHAAHIQADIHSMAAADCAPPATDTAAAVAAGIWCAVAGGVERAIARQRAALPIDHVILTGGDALRLAPMLAVKTQQAPDLVLRGLAILARAEGAVE